MADKRQQNFGIPQSLANDAEILTPKNAVVPDTNNILEFSAEAKKTRKNTSSD